MIDKVTKDLTNAMKNRDAFKLSVLRMLKTSLKNEEINKKSPLTDDEALAVIKKQVKSRKDAREEYLGYGREDLATDLQKEIDILNAYLPKELTVSEIEKIVDDAFVELKPTSMKDMGMIIKSIGAKYAASADMSIVSKLVKDKLSNI